MLPGGIVRGGERRRDYAFRAITGEVELAIAAAGGAPAGRPERVTRALVAAIAELGGEAATAAAVADLTVADRQFLMNELGRRLGHEPRWITARCNACGERFEVAVEPSTLPVKEAGLGYPVAEASTRGGGLRVRLPTGRDQEAVGDRAPADEARALVARCIEPSAASDLARALADDELAAVDAALDAVSPAVATAVRAACPECGRSAEVPVDPCGWLRSRSEELLDDVHRIASAYHWPERDILALSTDRRRAYLARIDRARGVAG